MTVTYPATATFKRLLLLWRGSIYKSVWKELLIYMILHFTLNMSYRFGMNDAQRKSFEQVVHYVQNWPSHIPLHFLLGFFVSYITGRWWEIFNAIPWPDQFLVHVTAYLKGDDNETRRLRRTIARYVNLHAVLTLRECCLKVKKRFPTEKHLLDAGLFTVQEYEMYQATTGDFGKWFTPAIWVVNLLHRCRKEGRIDSRAHQRLLDNIYNIRGSHGMITVYDWMNAPLRYCQIATLATYAYFGICLVARQDIETQVANYGTLNIYLPIVSIIEFVFYMGWLQVAEEYRFPFGEDDDDFDMNFIIDRNLAVSFMLVDELESQTPDITDDSFWGQKCPLMPHTKASILVKDRVPNWALHHEKIKQGDDEFLPPHNHYKEDPPGMSIHKRKRGGRVLTPEPKRKADETELTERLTVPAENV